MKVGVAHVQVYTESAKYKVKKFKFLVENWKEVAVVVVFFYDFPNNKEVTVKRRIS